jgi:hypothetical protein
MRPLVTAMALCIPSLAQAIEIEDLVTPSGYAEVRTTYSQIEGTPWTTQQRLRPTLKLYPTERTSLRLTIEAQHTQGRHDETEVVKFLDTSVQEIMDLTLAEVEALTGCHIDALPRVEDASDVVGVERLFIDFNRPSFDVRIGRQAIAWGSALGINPTDVFGEFLLSEPWRERSGVDAARITWAAGEHQVMAVAGVDQLLGSMDSDSPEWKTGARVTTHIGATDLSVVASTSRWRWDNQRSFVGIDIKGDWQLGWWLEGGYDGDIRVALGADYSFPLLQVLYLAAQLNYEGGGSAPGDIEPSLLGMEDLEICNCENLPGGIVLPIPAEPELGAPQTLTSGRLYGLLNLRWTLADDWTLYLTWLGGQRVTANIGIQAPLGSSGEFRPDAADLTLQGVDLSALIPQRTALAWLRVSL